MRRHYNLKLGGNIPTTWTSLEGNSWRTCCVTECVCVSCQRMAQLGQAAGTHCPPTPLNDNNKLCPIIWIIVASCRDPYARSTGGLQHVFLFGPRVVTREHKDGSYYYDETHPTKSCFCSTTLKSQPHCFKWIMKRTKKKSQQLWIRQAHKISWHLDKRQDLTHSQNTHKNYAHAWKPLRMQPPPSMRTHTHAHTRTHTHTHTHTHTACLCFSLVVLHHPLI